MIKEHICRGRPGYKASDDPWAEGHIGSCPYHNHKGPRARKVKGVKGWREDKAAGVIGTQRDGFISGVG